MMKTNKRLLASFIACQPLLGYPMPKCRNFGNFWLISIFVWNAW